MAKNTAPQQAKPKKVAKKEFIVDPELRQVADKVLENEGIVINPAKVEFLLVYPNVSKTVAGRCIRTGKELKFFSNFDYLIEMSGELWDALDEPTRYILMQHELMHINPTVNAKSGDWDFKLKPHDVQDFAKIINKHGVDWIQKVKLSVASLYDLDDPNEVSL